MKSIKSIFFNKLVILLIILTLCSAINIKEVKADSSIIYIIDTIGGETKIVNTETGGTGAGWTYEDNQLILDGFNGEAIESSDNFNLNIKLIGENKITPKADNGNETTRALYVKGTLTITKNNSDENDKLIIKQHNFKSNVSVIDADKTDLNGGTLDIDVEGNRYHHPDNVNNDLVVVKNNISVNNEAILKIKAVHLNVNGIEKTLDANTTGLIDISVVVNDSAGKNVDKAALKNLKVQSSGQIKLAAQNAGNSNCTPTDTNQKCKSYAIGETLEIAESGVSDIDINGAFSLRYTNQIINKIKFNNAKIGEQAISADNLFFDVFSFRTIATVANKFVLTDLNSDIISAVTIKTNGQGFNEALKFNKSPKFNIDKDNLFVRLDTGIKAGTGNGTYTFKLAEDSTLPPYLTLNQRGELVGTLTIDYPSGSFAVDVTSAGVTKTFTINYAEIKGMANFLIINGDTENKVSLIEDSSGAGWDYDSSNNTLILDDFEGESIKTESNYSSKNANLTIKLVGENKIIPDKGIANSKLNVIDIAGNLTIIKDSADDSDQLIVQQNNFLGGAYIVNTTGKVELNGGTLDIDVAGEGQAGYSIWVINNSIYVNNNASLKIKAKHANVRGVTGELYANTSGLIDIKVEGSGLQNAKLASSSLHVQESGPINLDAQDSDGHIVGGAFSVGPNATSTLNLKGALPVSSYALTSQLKLNRLKFKDAKIAAEDISSDKLIFSQPIPNPLNNYYLSNIDGEKITQVVVDTKGSGFNEELEFIQSDLFNIPKLKVNEPFRGTGKELNLISGVKVGTGNGNYTFNLAEGSTLPSGFNLTSAGKLSGTPSTDYVAGSFDVKVSSGEINHVFTIEYEGTLIDKPITDIEIAEAEFILNINEEVTPTINITPEDASINTYKLESDNKEIVKIIDENKLKALKVGETRVFAESTQGSLKAYVNVYVKEIKPKAKVEGLYLSDLVANQKYLINSTPYLSDSAGKIEIAKDWLDTTIQIVKVNDEAKCNSDAQSLEINKRSIKVYEDFIAIENQIYAEGEEIKPKIEIDELKEDVDYTLTYTNNINVGKATVKIMGIGVFEGSFTKDFNITPKTLTQSEIAIILSNESYIYNGEVQTPEVSVKYKDEELTNDDYIYETTSKNPTNIGTYKVEIKFINNYEGIAEVLYEIKAQKLSDKDVNIKLDSNMFIYDGKVKTPNISVEYQDKKLSLDNDYKLVLSGGRINVGTYKITIKFNNNYEGEVEKSYEIKPQSATKAKTTLSKTAYIYDKKVKNPSVKVILNNKTLKKNSDYDVKYQTGRKYVNRYYVKVNFKNNYSGNQTLYFKIIPKTTKISKLTAYQKKIKVNWSKQSVQTSGYQIYYSTSSKFTKYKTATIKSTKTTSKTVLKLIKNKKYYFKIRTYKNVKIDGKTTKIYSNFSKVKAKTTKK